MEFHESLKTSQIIWQQPFGNSFTFYDLNKGDEGMAGQPGTETEEQELMQKLSSGNRSPNTGSR